MELCLPKLSSLATSSPVITDHALRHARMTQPLHVGISATVIQRGRSGVAQYVIALVRALCEINCSAHRYTLFVLEEDRHLFDFAKSHMTIHIVAEKHRSPVRDILWHQTVLPGLVRKLGIEVLHVPSYRRMMWKQPCALVTTIHDLAQFRVKGKYDPLRMFYGRVVAKQLAKRQDQIIAISESTAADVEEFFGIPQRDQTIIHNGLEHDRFQPESKDQQRRIADSLTKPYFLYVSRIEHPAKNHIRLIDAFNHFCGLTGSDWELVLAGSDWHGAELVHEHARKSFWGKQIRFLGFVPDEELPPLYRRAGAMIYPSLFEGFGMPPVEAMACGCPVISSTKGSLKEVVGYSALHIDPEDTYGMAYTMRQVAAKGAIRQRLRYTGLLNARRFHWHNTARAVLATYKRAAHSAGVRVISSPADS